MSRSGCPCPSHLGTWDCTLRIPQKHFDSIARPGSHTSSEEVLILSPDRRLEHQGCRNDRPIVRIPEGDSGASKLFVLFVEASIYGLHDARDLVEYGEANHGVELAAAGDVGYIPSGILKTDVGAVECGQILIGFKEFANTNPENRAEKNVGIENQRLIDPAR